MSEPRIIAVTGASGLVGRELVARIESAGREVRRLVRRSANAAKKEVRWDPTGGEIDAAGLEGVEGVVHLAGENIVGRWTDAYKQRIVDSRVKGTRLIAETLAQLSPKPSVLVSASAIGFYGDRGDEPVDEDSPVGAGFLAETCQAWEAETRVAEEEGIRVVHLRVGLVLTPEGGLLGKILPIFRFGLGGVLGSGRQYMSWVSREDLVGSLLFALDNPSLAGPVNGVAPGAVTNRDFTASLGAALGRPTVLPVPAFGLRMVMGEMADEMALGGANVKPKRLIGAGFEFTDTELDAALARVL